jgi:alkyl sulfatase BDS1-like metallo-beta-lactamase superfamily hydrolase
MTSLQERSERLWNGIDTTTDPKHHPFVNLNQLEEVAPGVAFYKSFVNVTALRSAAGLLLIDTGSFLPAQHLPCFESIRRWSPERVHTAIYTHGHVDHAYGLPPYLREAEAKGWARPQTVGHAAVADRMQRYAQTAGYNGLINTRQFGFPLEWPTNPDPPTLTYGDRMQLRVGERELALVHARGETDDHTWIFLPDAKILCTGDLFIWAAPNAGNPQKVQRYALDWANALRSMAALEPAILLPGHGLPIFGAERVREALVDTAEYLESLYRQSVDAMNAGATIYDLIESVRPPAHLCDKPYLRPVYDEPEFIVRNVHRHLAGWYSGVPSELKPAPRRNQAREIAALAGGIARLLERAEQCRDAGDLRMACHLADWAAEAEPQSAEAHRLRARIYGERARSEPSTMSRGIFGAAARESNEKAGPTGPTVSGAR